MTLAYLSSIICFFIIGQSSTGIGSAASSFVDRLGARILNARELFVDRLADQGPE